MYIVYSGCKTLRNKILIFFTFFLVSLLAISAVSASEIDNDFCDDSLNSLEPVNNVDLDEENLHFNDENQVCVDDDEILSYDKSSTIYSSNSVGNSITVNGNTFEDIQNTIDMANDNDIIILSGSYKGNGSAIVVNKPLTFKGSNAILDAKGISDIFNINDPNVTLSNITFNNNACGFINIQYSGELNIFDCKFYGGDTYSTAIGARYRSPKINIYNSNFYNINIIGQDFALIKSKTLNLFNSSFSSCSGSIQFCNDSKIFHSNFNRCNSPFYNNNDLGGYDDYFNNTVFNTSFTNCNGSCISGKINNVTKCTFNNISSCPVRIYKTPIDKGIFIVDCTFMKINCNSSIVFLEMGSKNFTIFNCTFKNNIVSNNNLINTSHIKGKISYCNFISNSANYGISLFYGTAELEKNNFTNNNFKNCSIRTDGALVINSIIKILNLDTTNLYILENNTLEAIITDDSGNLIENTQLFAFMEYTGDEYISSYILPKKGKFNITVYSDKIGLNNLTIGGIYEDKVVLENFSLNLFYRPNSFSYITYLITNSNDGDILELDDYYEGKGYPIEINKSLIIKSKNNFSVFDAKNLSDIFHIYADNVTLMNLYFINSIQPINWQGKNGNLKNCIFESNSQGFYSANSAFGGACAIYWRGDNGTVFNSTFINNIANASYASAASGAINWAGNFGKIMNSTFINCSSFNAAAISSTSQNLEIISSKFINCSSKGNKDSGILIFNLNKGNYTFSILDCDFINNTALKGGSISVPSTIQYICNISGCKFINNSANYGTVFYGKGVKNSNSSVMFSDCLFEENYAKTYGCIYTAAKTVLNNSKFINNNGSIYCENTLHVNNSNFISNYAISDGGAIYLKGNDSFITNSNFIDNYAECGGAILIKDSSFFRIEFCNFEDNRAGNLGGAIDCSGVNMYIGDCSFLNNFAETNGGAIYCYSDGNNLFNLSFINNGALSDGGAIYLSGDYSFVGSSIFVSNAAYRGGAAYISGDLLDFIDNTLKDNYALKEAGAIYLAGSNHTISVSSFINNIANNESGAIHWLSENSILNNSIFTNNLAELNENTSTVSWYCENATIENTFMDKNNENIPTNFLISEPIINLSISNEGRYYGNYNLIVNLQLGSIGIPNQDVTLKLSNGVTFLLTTDEEGFTFCNLPFNAGSYVVDGSFRNGNLTVTKKFSFTINKIPTTVTPTALSTTYNSGKYFTLKLVDKNSKKVLSNIKLKLRVYTGTKYKDYYVTTNSNGIAKFKASTLAVGTHKVEITSANNNYAVTKTTSTIKIAKAKTIIKAPKVTYKYKKSKYFSVTVKNKATKKVVKSLKVKVKVYTGKKYKTYTIKTNSKGIAKLNTKTLTKGTHKVVISSGNSNYAISAKSTIVIKK